MDRVPLKYVDRLLESSLDIVVATDADGKVIFYSDGVRKTLGYARDPVRNQPVTNFYPSLEEARKVMRAMRDDPDGRIMNFESVFVAKDGKQVPVSITGAIIYDTDGTEIGSIGFAKDLREIRRKDQLATLGEIAVGLSHEINNPLTVIWNNLEIIRSALKGDAARMVEDNLVAIRTEVERIRMRIETVELMARTGVYASKEYLRGAQMIDLVASHRGAQWDQEDKTGHNLKGLRILVVDDDESVTSSIMQILRSEGCEVTTAGSGEQAIERCKEAVFDLVLSDVVMPGMDGYDLYLELKAANPSMAMILMTAYYYDKDHIIKRSKLEGLEGSVFKKPINPDHLKKVITKACRLAE
ncbi:MAG: response regulator [Deltaproteobacteria bacterium]|nr:response regulator [Deltaproteobacteria bacterium]